MTSYEVWLDSGENITVEADSVYWDDGVTIFQNEHGGLVAMIPFPWIKLVRVKPADSP